MQAELIRDIEPPSYEESVYFKQLIDKVKAQRRKTPPPSYDNSNVFDMFKQTQLGEKKGAAPFEIGKTITASPSECCHDDENQQDSPMDVRLERVSSCLQQMIDAANQSLITSSTITPENSDTDGNTDALDEDATLMGHIAKEQRMKSQQWRINRKKSLDRLKSSQDSLARTIDELNLSISQHITNKTASPTYNYTQHNHHHHHHHYYYYQQAHPTGKQRTMSRKSSISLWTSILTQAALVYGICHQLLSCSTPTSSIVSVAWFVTMLLVKKKSNINKLGLIMSKSSSTEYLTSSSTNMPFYPNPKSSLLLRYSSLLSLFRKQ